MKRGDQQSKDSPSDEHPSGELSGCPETQNNGGPDDPVLLEAALRGDIEAFGDLFESYRQRLYALCLKRLSDHSLAEDVVQEVFVRAFISLPNYHHRNLFWQWLATIAIRMCIDLQRSRSLTKYSEDIEVAVDAAANREALEVQTSSALDAVIVSERHEELFRSLEVLPKRQRRVFLLYALDDWSCAEIAEAEGISVGAVHLLLFRARRKMRSLREKNVPPPAIVIPFSWLRWKFHRMEERIRPLLGVYGEGLPSACVQAVCLGALAMIAVATANPGEASADNAAGPSGEIVTQVSILSPMQAPTLQAAWPKIGAPTKAPVEPQQSVADSSSSLVDDVINPNQNATPENSQFGSVTVSPNYESDHTILAAGSYSSNYVLFVSHDGGGTWKPRPSRLLNGSTVVLPPDFPQDRRIFTYGGDLGLQQSDDWGEIFRVVSPVPGRGIAISPTFGGDSKILMGGKAIFEFDADTRVTQPALLVVPPAPWGDYPHIAFSPGYLSDSTVFVSESTTTHYRCEGVVCDRTQLQFPTFGPLRFRFSPRFDQDGLVYAFTPSKLLVSKDGGRTFGEIQFPVDEGHIFDVAILWNTSSNPTIFAYVAHKTLSGAYRSLDGGRSWAGSPIGIDTPYYDYYSVNKLIVTPTGRLLVVGGYGLACSENGGQTWAPRCTPEP